MVTALTLRALARAEESGLLEALNIAVSGTDPLLKPFVTARVNAAVRRAQQETSISDPSHVLRVAFLTTLPQRPQLTPNDAEAVQAAYTERLSTMRIRRRPFWALTTPLLIVALLTVAIVGGGALWRWMQPRAEDAFLHTPFGRALGKPFTDFVVAIDNPDENRQHREVLESNSVRRQLGDEVFLSYSEMLTASERLATSVYEKKAVDEYQEQLRQLNRTMGEHHVPAHFFAFVQGQGALRPRIWLVSFVVRRRNEVSIGGESTQVVWGRRIDSLNFTTNAYAVVEGNDSILVSIDHNEERFMKDVIIPIGQNRELPIADRIEVGDNELKVVIEKATERVKGEFLEKSDLTESDWMQIASMMVRRNQSLVSLKHKRYHIPRTERFVLPDEAVEFLSKQQDPDAYEVRKMNDVLRTYQKQFDSALALSLRLMEQQFVARTLEQRRLKLSQVPYLKTRFGKDTAFSRAVVSSELAKLAREEATPRYALWGTVREALQGEQRFVIVLDALCVELGYPGYEEWTARGRMNKASMAPSLRRLFETEPAKIRDAATKAYKKIFERDPPEIKIAEL